MLGRKDYTRKELDDAKATVAQQLAAYEKLAKAVAGSGDPKATRALEAFEPHFVDSLLLALDRRLVHRLRAVTGKDGNPLNELELLTESQMNNDGVLRGNNVIKFVPDQSVLGLEPGDEIQLTAAQFGRLADAVFADLEAKFL